MRDRYGELLAEHRSVDLRLRPMQLAVIRRHAIEVALERLDLFEQLALGVVAVGTPAHEQVLVRTAERELGAIARAAAGRDGSVAGDAFLRARRWREAQVEVADFGSELAQRANRDRVGRRNRHGRIFALRRAVGLGVVLAWMRKVKYI